MKSKLSPKLLSLCIASAISGTASAEIFISEYVEGGSNNKAVEIANTGDTQVNLNGYKLVKSTNGATLEDGSFKWGSELSLDGLTIEAGKVIVLSNPSAKKAIKDLAKKTSGSVLNHSGNDPIGILDPSGNLIDVIGVPGAANWGKDKTLIRNASGQSASATYNPKHWNTLPKDNIDDLGKFTVPAAPAAFKCSTNPAEFKTINEIQGDDLRSPLLADGEFTGKDDIYVKGIVAAVTTGLTKGFYLQAETPDNNPKTSDGLFISTGEGVSALKPGDLVCVKGKVNEYYDNTQLKSDGDSYIKTGTTNAPAATKLVVEKAETLADALERYEGMLIELDAGSDLFITRNFSYDYAGKRNNMVLSHKAPLFKPTQLFAAETPQVIKQANDNKSSRVVLESDQYAARGKVPYYADFAKDEDQNGSSEHHIRLGSRIEGLQAVVNYSHREFRLIATNQLTSDNFVTSGKNSDGKAFDVARTAAPSIADSDLRIASFNVLNYFNTTASGEKNPTGQNRGAKKRDEFDIQKAKIVNAISKMDADIVGLMEIENNGFADSSAVKDLTDALNAEFANADDHYTYVVIADADKYQDQFLGSDAITVAMLYRASKVTPKQAAQVIETPEQHVAKDALQRTVKDKAGKDVVEFNPQYKKAQRHSLLQTFTVKQTSDDLSIVVNHFKSKGSNCIEEWLANAPRDPNDLQGNCNRFRVSAAQVLGEALKDIKGDVLVMGDLNAYGMEDPLLVLTDYDSVKNNYDRKTIMTASYTTLGKNEDGTNKVYEQKGSKIDKGYGYINLNTALHGTDTYSYTYGGELGNLDHALASDSLANKVVAIEDWHINSAETNMFEYSSKYTGDMPKYKDAYSASDHDPVVIAIDLPEAKMELPMAGSGEQLSVDVTLPLSTKVGDIVTVTFTESVASRAAQPAVKTYTASAKVTQEDLDKRMIAVKFDKMPQAGNYKVEQKLADKDGKEKMTIYSGDVTVQSSSSTSSPSKPASTTTKVGSSGSFGFGAMLSLFGLAAWRRRKQA